MIAGMLVMLIVRTPDREWERVRLDVMDQPASQRYTGLLAGHTNRGGRRAGGTRRQRSSLSRIPGLRSRVGHDFYPVPVELLEGEAKSDVGFAVERPVLGPESRAMTIDDVDLSAAVLTVRNAKRGKSRLIPVSSQLARRSAEKECRRS